VSLLLDCVFGDAAKKSFDTETRGKFLTQKPLVSHENMDSPLETIAICEIGPRGRGKYQFRTDPNKEGRLDRVE
jgi:hypothetical protein